MKRKLLMLVLGLGLLAPIAAHAEVKDPLLKKLVDKGTLTTQEAEDVEAKTSSPLQGFSLSGVAYLDYSFGQHGGATKTNYNTFSIQRAYVNVKKEIAPWLKVRVTTDIKGDSDGYKLRMKYTYADILVPDAGFLTGNDVRAGLGHTPFLDFEEAINGYRMQGAMFQDRNGLITSSDIGVSVLGNFGGKLTKEQTEEVGNHHYNGRYGTYHIGVYNGGGYGVTSDNNQNKSIQGRVTVRPLPDMLPGLQITYLGITGKGDSDNTSWTNNTGFISYQSSYGVVTAEVMRGKNNKGGTSATKKSGYSFFGSLNVPQYKKVAVFARYDSLDPDRDTSNDRITTTIGGVSYRLYKGNYIVAAYEKTHDKTKAEDDKKGQVVLQVSF